MSVSLTFSASKSFVFLFLTTSEPFCMISLSFRRSKRFQIGATGGTITILNIKSHMVTMGSSSFIPSSENLSNCLARSDIDWARFSSDSLILTIVASFSKDDYKAICLAFLSCLSSNDISKVCNDPKISSNSHCGNVMSLLNSCDFHVKSFWKRPKNLVHQLLLWYLLTKSK